MVGAPRLLPGASSALNPKNLIPILTFVDFLMVVAVYNENAYVGVDRMWYV